MTGVVLVPGPFGTIVTNPAITASYPPPLSNSSLEVTKSCLLFILGL
jgi:hypothetical protein